MWFMFSDFIFQGALKFWRKLEDRVLKDGFRFCWGYPKSGLFWSSYSDQLSSNLGILEDSFQGHHQHHVVESFGWHIIVKLRFVFKSVLSKCPVKSSWFENDPGLKFLLHVAFRYSVLVSAIGIGMSNMMMVTCQGQLPKNDLCDIWRCKNCFIKIPLMTGHLRLVVDILCTQLQRQVLIKLQTSWSRDFLTKLVLSSSKKCFWQIDVMWTDYG